MGIVWPSSPFGQGRRRFGGPDAQVARTAGKARPLTQAASARNVALCHYGALIFCSVFCA